MKDRSMPASRFAGYSKRPASRDRGSFGSPYSIAWCGLRESGGCNCYDTIHSSACRAAHVRLLQRAGVAAAHYVSSLPDSRTGQIAKRTARPGGHIRQLGNAWRGRRGRANPNRSVRQIRVLASDAGVVRAPYSRRRVSIRLPGGGCDSLSLGNGKLRPEAGCQQQPHIRRSARGPRGKCFRIGSEYP
jgi:hypothetical protein